MNYIGIDLHRDFFVAVAQDNSGTELFRKRYHNSTRSVDLLLEHFPEPPSVVVEATRNWMWFIKAVQQHGCNIQLAHPFRLKAIASARIKTDSIDAKTLCDLLRADLIPQSYISSPEELDNRELSRGRINLVHDQTILKNRILAILGKDNLRFSGTDLFGIKGRQWLTKQSLSEVKQKVIDVYLTRLINVQEAIATIDEEIEQRSSSIPEVSLLQTIPGIGITTAFLLASEIGTIKRFPNAKKFTSYFGLVPRLSQSGNHAYYGRITKLGNPYVRWSLVQAAHRLARSDKESKRFTDRLSYRHGKKKAIVALARKLATIVYTVLKENRTYQKDYRKTFVVCPAIIPDPD